LGVDLEAIDEEFRSHKQMVENMKKKNSQSLSQIRPPIIQVRQDHLKEVEKTIQIS